jgi:carbon-monoxide dehydrogenase medium subunit
MIPAPFGYERAATLNDALEALASADGSLKVLAGGQSLLPLMKLRLARPEGLLDIGRLDELRGIRSLDSGGIAIGALTTWVDLLAEPQVLAYGALADAIPTVGDLQVRNRGTIGGSLAHADPAADITAPALVLDFELVARSARGERTIAIAEFLLGPFTTALGADEILIEVRIPPPQPGEASAYRFVAQPASGYPIAGVAVLVRHTGAQADAASDTGPECRIAVTGVADTPYRATDAEAAIREGADASEAMRLVTQEKDVLSDIHADADYRATVAAVMARRAFEAATSAASAANPGAPV